MGECGGRDGRGVRQIPAFLTPYAGTIAATCSRAVELPLAGFWPNSVIRSSPGRWPV